MNITRVLSPVRARTRSDLTPAMVLADLLKLPFVLILCGVGLLLPQGEVHKSEYDRKTTKEHDESGAFWGGL